MSTSHANRLFPVSNFTQWSRSASLAGLGLCLGILAGCAKSPEARPSRQTPGVATFQFSKKIQGPVELTVDGVRVPVQGLKKNKSATRLVVSGFTPGKHRYFLFSAREAFSPDQGEFEIVEGQGFHQRVLAQTLNATLYGKSEESGPANPDTALRAQLEK